MRRCLKNLTLYGLLDCQDRGHLGKTNLYRITKFSAWKPADEALRLQEAQKVAWPEQTAGQA